MKIAVASTDGENINLHFGKAKNLYIYNLTEEKIEFIEKREVNIDNAEKHQGSKVIDAIKDCDGIIVVKYGVKSKIKANKIGLKIIIDEGPIEEGLKRYQEHMKFMNR